MEENKRGRPKEADYQRLSINLPPHLYHFLKAKSQRDYRSMASLIREAVANYFSIDREREEVK